MQFGIDLLLKMPAILATAVLLLNDGLLIISAWKQGRKGVMLVGMLILLGFFEVSEYFCGALAHEIVNWAMLVVALFLLDTWRESVQK